MKPLVSIKRRILEEIFKIAPENYEEKDLNNHPLTKKLNISEKELINSINFLIELGLLRRLILNRKPTLYAWQITEKGFDYLEEKSREDNSSILQMTMVYLTLILAINGIETIYLTIYDKFRGLSFFIYGFFLFLTAISLNRNIIWKSKSKKE